MTIRSFAADAVVMATGGPGLVFGKSTNSVMCTEPQRPDASLLERRTPTGSSFRCTPPPSQGADKLRLMSESARGEGGRVWVPKAPGDARDPRDIPAEDRWYFLEEKYPAYGNLVPRDIASREIFSVCVDEGMGVRGENQVYLDLTHKPRDYLETKLGPSSRSTASLSAKIHANFQCESSRGALLNGRAVDGVHRNL